MLTAIHPVDEFIDRLSMTRLPDAARHALRAFAVVERLDAGSSFGIDDAESRLVFLKRGSTKLVAHASHDRDQIIAFHFAGDTFWIPASDNYSYSLCALRETELIRFPADRFLVAVEGQPQMIRTLLEKTTVALRRSREKTVALGRKTAAERIAVFLLGMAERIGEAAGNGVIIDLPMSRRDIADSLGMTIETVSRQLTHLREAGFIETEGRSLVRLRDMSELRVQAGYLPDAP